VFSVLAYIITAIVNAGGGSVCSNWCWGASIWLSSTWSSSSSSSSSGSTAAPLVGLALRLLDAVLYIWVGYALTLLLR
jgi:hypothetical protein